MMLREKKTVRIQSTETRRGTQRHLSIISLSRQQSSNSPKQSSAKTRGKKLHWRRRSVFQMKSSSRVSPDKVNVLNELIMQSETAAPTNTRRQRRRQKETVRQILLRGEARRGSSAGLLVARGVTAGQDAGAG